MKQHLFYLLFPIFFLCCASASETSFQPAKAPAVDVSTAFVLGINDRAVIKTASETYLVLQLLDSQREEGNEGSTESCTVIWMLISSSGAHGGTTNAYIKYKRTQKGENEYFVEQVAGSDYLELEEYKLQWSYRSSSQIFIYPLVGMEYAVVKL